MNTLCDQFEGCVRHPHREVVGVCSSCLQERLLSLLEPASPLPAVQTRRSTDASEQPLRFAAVDKRAISNPAEQGREQEQHVKAYVDSARPALPCELRDAIAGMVPRSGQDAHFKAKGTTHASSTSVFTATAQLNHDKKSLPLGKAGHVEHRLPSDSPCGTGKVYQNGHIKKHDGNDLVLPSKTTTIEKQNRSAHPQAKHVEISFSERDKNGESRFSLPRSKGWLQPIQSHTEYQSVSKDEPQGLQNSGARPKSQQPDGKSSDKSSDCRQHVPRPDLDATIEITTNGDASSMIHSHASGESAPPNSGAGTKSQQPDEKSLEKNSDSWQHLSRPDLVGTAAITTNGDASSMIHGNASRESAAPTFSWISILFHRKKWSRFWPRTSIQNAGFDSNIEQAHSIKPNHDSNSGPDTGQISCDGARPNLRQLLKKIETQSKPPAPHEAVSTTQYAMKQQNNNGRDVANEARILQKSKSIATSRSSISVEMPRDVKDWSLSPSLHQDQSDAMVGLDHDLSHKDQNLLRSRSWGRNWNRAVSPLWGSRSHRHKVTFDASASAHQCNYSRIRNGVTPSHASVKTSAAPLSSVHSSPLRARGKLVSSLKNLL